MIVILRSQPQSSACNKAGGGRVTIPKGIGFALADCLLSNVNVHLQAGAHVYFSNNPDDYAKYGAFDCGANGVVDHALGRQ